METTRDAMLWALDCLKRHELKLLKSKLGDCTIKDGTAIPAGLMERADNNKLVDLLIDRCTKRKAPVVLIGALQRCSKNELAEQLNEKLEKIAPGDENYPEGKRPYNLRDQKKRKLENEEPSSSEGPNVKTKMALKNVTINTLNVNAPIKLAGKPRRRVSPRKLKE